MHLDNEAMHPFYASIKCMHLHTLGEMKGDYYFWHLKRSIRAVCWGHLSPWLESRVGPNLVPAIGKGQLSAETKAERLALKKVCSSPARVVPQCVQVVSWHEHTLVTDETRLSAALGPSFSLPFSVSRRLRSLGTMAQRPSNLVLAGAAAGDGLNVRFCFKTKWELPEGRLPPFFCCFCTGLPKWGSLSNKIRMAIHSKIVNKDKDNKENCNKEQGGRSEKLCEAAWHCWMLLMPS